MLQYIGSGQHEAGSCDLEQICMYVYEICSKSKVVRGGVLKLTNLVQKHFGPESFAKSFHIFVLFILHFTTICCSISDPGNTKQVPVIWNKYACMYMKSAASLKLLEEAF